MALYYNVIIAWSLFYLGNSFQYPLPWHQCPIDVNTNETGPNVCISKNAYQMVTSTQDQNLNIRVLVWTVKECARSSPTSYFWFRKALSITNSIEDSGEFNPIMTGCLLAAWAIVSLAMIKGIKSSAKVLFFFFSHVRSIETYYTNSTNI